jgi:hypothetical protein
MRNILTLIVGAVVAAAGSWATAEDKPQPQANWLACAPNTDSSAPSPQATATQPTCEPAPAKAKPLIGDEPYEVRFKVYGWLTSVDGTVRAGRASSNIDISYCDVLDNLDLIECMVPVNLEARLGRWGVYADLFYAKLEDTVHVGPGGQARVHLVGKQTILELGGFYRAGVWSMAPNCGNSLSLDILGGARYNRLEGNFGLQAPGHSIAIGGAREWWDPFVGPRVIWNANEKFSLFARGDVGGFGLDNSSHFAWQIIAGGDYYFTENIFAELGYRLLDTNFSTLSGPRPFTYDVQMAGPYLALGVKF